MTVSIGKVATPAPNQFVPLTTQIAGLSLSSSISANQLFTALGLAVVARPGSYNDLLDKPVQVKSNWQETNTSSPAYILGKPNLQDLQTRANMVGVVNGSSPTAATNYPNIAAIAAFCMPLAGGQHTGIAKAFNNPQPAVSQMRNIRFIQGDSSQLPADAVDGEIIALYD